jgi:parallel beta-helix repeat protein
MEFSYFGGNMNTQPGVNRRGVYWILRSVIVLALLGFLASPPRAVHASGPYVVDVIYDGHDYNLSDGICYDGVSGCPLRAAIEQATNDGVATTITFSSGIANQTLLVEGYYGMISWAGSYITVNGESNNITISGQNLNDGQSVIRIWGSQNVLENVSIRQSKLDGVQVGDFGGVGEGNSNTLYNVKIYNSVAAGIYIYGSSSAGGNSNSVQSSLIGASSYSDNLCSTSIRNGYAGIYIAGGASNTVISGNRIVCSGNAGIYIAGSGGASTNTQIFNNSIGTDGASFSLGNGEDGIHDDHNSGTVISGNTISGNTLYGVWLHGSTGASLTANKIGTDSYGSTALPNQWEGVAITDSASGNTIGDAYNTSLGNIISGNNGSGVAIASGSYNNVLDGNYIGLGTGGTTVIPNALAGVAFSDVSNNALSASDATANQYIAGNHREGVYVINSYLIFVNSATYIGVAANGAPAGNDLEGVKLDSGTTNTTIRPGKIMYSGGTGIAVFGNTSIGNMLTPSMIGSNVGLPIDLGNDGATDNGMQSPPGPNNWIGYPTITGSNGRHITGSTCPGCDVYIYRATGNPRAAAGGGLFIMYVSADGTGNFGYTIPSGVPAITMIACDTNWGCSEMSPKHEVEGFSIYLPLILRQ